jgi:hypothetical protein
MTHQNFSKFHNKYIRFHYNGSPLELSGVVIDILNYNEKKAPTEYVFIAMKDLLSWQKADKEGNVATKKSLQNTIDIDFISSPELVHPSHQN